MSELYKLPDGWEWKNIGETCENLDRLRKPISQKDRIFGKYPYYGATKIVDYIDDYIFDEQLILIGEDGAKWDIGDETAFLATGKYWVNNHAHVIRPNRKILDDSWLVYYLFVADLSDYITGTTVPKLNQTKLKEISFPLPPLHEQKRIVSKLDILFQILDKAIALHQKNIDEADVFMGSVLNDVFGELEEKYPIKTVDDISLNVRYGYTDSAKDKGNAVFIRITDINDNGKFKDNFVYVDIDNKELNKFKLYKGDILVARSGATAGKVALFDLNFISVFASYLIRIQPNKKIDSSFLFYFCHSPKYWEQLIKIKVGGAQPNVNATNLKKLKLATPPLSAQQKVVKYLDEVSEKIEKLKSVQKEKMQNLIALKASILDRAFRGEL